MSSFWKQILDSKNPSSSKRLVTLIISGLFIVSCFSILFVAFYVIFFLPRGKVDRDLLEALKQVLEYEFYIILSGLGFVTVDNMGQMMIERTKAKNTLSTPPVVEKENVKPDNLDV